MNVEEPAASLHGDRRAVHRIEVGVDRHLIHLIEIESDLLARVAGDLLHVFRRASRQLSLELHRLQRLDARHRADLDG